MYRKKLRYIGTPDFFNGFYFRPGREYNGYIEISPGRYGLPDMWIVRVIDDYGKRCITIPYSHYPIGRYWEYC